MKSISAFLGMALFGGYWPLMMLGGCSAPQLQQVDANGIMSPSQRPATIAASQLTPLLSMVSQLRMASQESLEAAKLVGTPDPELTSAQQAHTSAEQLLQEGRAAYAARQYEQSWDKLQAADAAFRRAEEAAVRAGLRQLERELVADYGRLLNLEGGGGRRATGPARVSQGSITLRDGAGMDFQAIGKAQLGDTLSILAESGEWYRVRTGTGLVGWVSKILVTRFPSR
jgi:Bacterial SH3 domain